MFSFQPAAFIGNTARWKDDYRAFSGDEVWARIEEGAGGRLHHRALQIGDARCNRTAYGAYVGDRYVAMLDEDDARDAAWLQDFVAAFGGMDFAVRARRARRAHGARLRPPPARAARPRRLGRALHGARPAALAPCCATRPAR